MSTIEKWETLRKSELAAARILRLVAVERRPPPAAGSSEPATFYVVELPSWVNVVALTDEGEMLLVRQYRHGTDAVTLEIPGGNVDPGESPLEAAERELREETGYVCERWHEIGMVEPNPAIQDNRCWTYLGTGARPAAAQDPDEHEELEVVRLPRDAVDARVDDGTITHALVVAALYHLRRWERRRG